MAIRIWSVWGCRWSATVLLACVGVSLLAFGSYRRASTSEPSCGNCDKWCTTPIVGNDGQTRYKRQCCGLNDECGERQYPGDNGPSPYCKFPCKKLSDNGRWYSTHYDSAAECCDPISGVQPKYPIRNLALCTNWAPRRDAGPEPNGCGTKDKPVDPTDKEAGRGGGKADFTAACNQHDTCYDTCNSDRSACDAKFLENMYKECGAKYPAGSKGLTHCKAIAKNGFYAGASSILGYSAYNAAQQRVCQCCS